MAYSASPAAFLSARTPSKCHPAHPTKNTGFFLVFLLVWHGLCRREQGGVPSGLATGWRALTARIALFEKEEPVHAFFHQNPAGTNRPDHTVPARRRSHPKPPSPRSSPSARRPGTGNRYPLGHGGDPFDYQAGGEYQEVYSSSAFSSLSGPLTITSIAFASAPIFSIPGSQATYNLTMDLSTTSAVRPPRSAPTLPPTTGRTRPRCSAGR